VVSRKFALFVALSGFAAIVNVVSRIGFGQFTSYGVSIVLAFCVALTTAFVLNRRFVFTDHAGDHKSQALRFTIVNLLSLVQVWALSELFVRVIFPRIGMHWQAETVAHAIGVASPVLTSYFAHKHFSFAAAPTSPR